MKHRFLVLIFLGAIQFVQAQSAEQAVLNLSLKKFDWMVRKRLDSLASILDDRLMYVHSNGWTESKQELIQDIQSGKLEYNAIEIGEATARIFINTAIVTGKGKFSVKLSGSDLAINLFYTEVYILKNDSWLLVTRHSNKM